LWNQNSMSFSISMAISVLMKGSYCTASRSLISRLLSLLMPKGLGFPIVDAKWHAIWSWKSYSMSTHMY
jgi:hypothetical protein